MQTDRPVALITGASSGIGAAFARSLAKRGYDLIVVARRRDLLEQLAQELAAGGCAVEVIEADLTEPASLAAVENRLLSGGPVDLLVNNAGFGTTGMFPKTDLAGQDKMHKLHVIAPMRLTHAALQSMTARNKGAIINVASVAAFAMSAGNVSYCATKAWMKNFSEGLAMELTAMRSAVRVQALCPGFTYSEFHDAMKVPRSAVPKSLWMDAGFVVQESLDALDRGDLFVIPGWKYRLFVGVLPFIPRRIRHAVGARSGRRMKRV